MQKFFAYTYIIFSLLILSGCAYKEHNIELKQKTNYLFHKTKNNINLSISTLLKNNNTKEFTDFVPLSVEIKNNTDKPINFNTQNISLPLTSLNELKNKIPRIYSKHFIPSSLFLAGSILIYRQVCLPLVGLSSLGAFLYGNYKHKKIIKILRKITLDPNQKIIIKPNKTLRKLFFIKKENYTPNFKVQLLQEKQNILFDVLISSQKSFEYKIN